jgi:two-component system, OmpR family, response regulator
MNAQSREGTGKRSLRILCVEDHPLVAEAFVHLFSKAGHVVEAIHDGLKAWERLSRNVSIFDLIILEHALPELDGLALVALLRLAHYPGKIVVHTSHLTAEQRERYQDLHVDFIFAKGFQSQDLFTLVDLLAMT